MKQYLSNQLIIFVFCCIGIIQTAESSNKVENPLQNDAFKVFPLGSRGQLTFYLRKYRRAMKQVDDDDERKEYYYVSDPFPNF